MLAKTDSANTEITATDMTTAFAWAGLLARAVLTATGVALTLMMLVALTTQLSTAHAATQTVHQIATTDMFFLTGLPWIPWIATGIGFLIVAAFGARVLTLAHRLIDSC